MRNSRGFQYRTSTIWVACHGLPPERPYPGTTWAVPLGCLLVASDAHDGAQGLGDASGKLEGNLKAINLSDETGCKKIGYFYATKEAMKSSELDVNKKRKV